VPPLLGRVFPPLVLAICAFLLAPDLALADPSDLDRRIAAAQDRLEALVEQHNAVQADLNATRVREAATDQRVKALSGQLSAAQDRVGAIAAWAYKKGPSNKISAAFTSGSPAVFIDRLALLGNLARADHRVLAGVAMLTRQLTADRKTLQRLATQQSEQAASLAALVTQVQQELSALSQLRASVGATSRSAPAGTADPPSTSDPAPPAQGAAARAVAFALAQRGKPYRFGTDGPYSYDCSGLTSAAWRAAGVILPHNAARQYQAMPHISRAQLVPGDLVFYYRDIHHVAMYVGNGSIVHAPNVGERVRVQNMDYAFIHGYGRPA
jgi:cell wall-associated NlpC family hydrolase